MGYPNQEALPGMPTMVSFTSGRFAEENPEVVADFRTFAGSASARLRNGSGSQTASVLPSSSCASMSGNGISLKLIAVGSAPASAALSMMVRSPWVLTALTETVRSSRSAKEVMPESARATTPLMSLPSR